MPVESVTIEWEEFTEVFLGKYFPHEMIEVKVNEFINLSQGNMSVDEYSLKFTLLSNYGLSLVSNPRDEMSGFVTGVADLVKEECRMDLLHNVMNLSRLMVYAQSIEESKLSKITIKLKRGIFKEKNQPRFKKRDPKKDGPSYTKANYEEVAVLKVLSLLPPVVVKNTLVRV